MARPLKIVGTVVQEINNDEVNYLAYYLQVAYANQLDAGGNGSINVGGTGVNIGSSTDTSSTLRQSTNSRNYSGGTDYVGAPGIGSETDANYSYKQIQTVPSFPSTATLNSDGYLCLDGSSGYRIASSASDLYDEIIATAISELKSGNEVGSYRIATSSPGTGWVSKGAWYVDTTYSAGTTTYNLYLRKSNAAPTSQARPMQLDGASGIIAASGTMDQSHAIIQNVLLPALTRRLSNGNLKYTVGTSLVGTDKGVWSDTKQTAGTDTFTFSNPTYTSTSTPSGAKVVQNTYYLGLA